MASPSGTLDEASTWKRCSTCRGPIGFGRIYYVCSVSTCNRKRTVFRFCAVECWEEHLPLMRHREAWAVEETAPSREQWAEQNEGPKPQRRRPTTEVAPVVDAVREGGAPRRRIRVGSAPKPPPEPTPGEVLVVVSRFKNYVKERFGMKTSDAVMDALSSHLRFVCQRASENAKADGRKTLLDRDFEFLRGR
ncbi:MAG: hypothetical protein K0V04_44905 [Deltaproteobacteria bacterium]|nr:hypothetical protein [Deltaproteobacteria bacterium]